MRLAKGFAALVLLLGALPVQAHTRSETFSTWQVAGDKVRLQYLVPETEARRVARDGEQTPSDEELVRYLGEHVGASVGEAACERSAAPRSLAATSGFRRFEFAFRCPQAKGIQLRSTAFFDVVATHTNFARVESAGHFAEQLLTVDHPQIGADADSANPLQSASFFKYVWLGMLHIATGPDHQSFLLGLVLISRRLRDLVFVVTGFTLGHSATLALAVTGLIRPHPEFIDALVGLTIALIGAENIIAQTHKPLPVALGLGALLATMAAAQLLGIGNLPSLLLLGAGLFSASYLMVSGHLRDAARLRLVVTLVFGLIHGFGFASDLLEMRLPAGRIAELLFGFNLGVEIAQLTLVAAATGVVLLAVRLRATLPRPLVTDVAASGLAGLGLFWFVARCYA